MLLLMFLSNIAAESGNEMKALYILYIVYYIGIYYGEARIVIVRIVYEWMKQMKLELTDLVFFFNSTNINYKV